MKLAKRLTCVILAMFMVFALVGCIEDDTVQTSGNNNNNASDPAAPEGETPADPDSADEAKDEDKPAPREQVVFDNSGYDGPWPDFNDYVPFSYDMNRVIYASDFSNADDICLCLTLHCGGEETGCENGTTWRRRWDGNRAIRPMVGDERIDTTVFEFYGPLTLTLCTDNFITGSSSLLISNRASDWNAAIFDITDLILDNVTEYEIFAWVKMDTTTDNPGKVMLSAQTNGYDGEEYRQWSDFGMLDEDDDDDIYHASKYWFPVEMYLIAEDGTEPNPDEYAEFNIPREFYRDGWVLLRGTTTLVKMFYEQIQVYVESKEGNANLQPIYIDSITIMTV
jgi:hypothetical protein